MQKICQGSSWPTVKTDKSTTHSSQEKYATQGNLEKQFRTPPRVTDRLSSGRNLAGDQLIAESSLKIHSMVGMLVECISFYIFEVTPWSGP